MFSTLDQYFVQSLFSRLHVFVNVCVYVVCNHITTVVFLSKLQNYGLCIWFDLEAFWELNQTHLAFVGLSGGQTPP